jgi:outer membrane protein assembly factor BamD
MTDLRDDADRVMHKNFPDSAHFKGATGNKDPWWMLWGDAW